MTPPPADHARPDPMPVTPKGRNTRESLLKAGEAVAERDGLGSLSVAAVATQAGVAKGTFYVYFADRNAFVDALHQRFYEQVADVVSTVTAGLEPGREFLVAAIDAYLDVCLANRAVKAFTFEARARGALTDTMADRVDHLMRLAEPSVRALGMTPTWINTRLIMAITSEAALIELEAGHEIPAARDTVRSLLDASR
ncbi:TetR family transcriptional regulator [Streptomyces sp. DW26H14]|uniref:TetR family transcriptional regulator n=1 Tax=Streptomyces sp. DW26H14 TaxID=3435395 RepID=UPI00403D5627